MNTQKEALMQLWKDTCTVIIREKRQNPRNKQTEFDEKTAYENQACKLSFETLSEAADGRVSGIAQGVKLFIGKDVHVPPGSKITVYRNGELLGVYKNSGEPGVFSNHQEIPLALFKEWA